MINLQHLPKLHRRFIENSLPRFQQDSRLLGVAAGGSFLLGSMDEFSDLDLVVVVDPAHYSEVLEDRKNIASRIGNLIESFTGEHVGEPRLLICLYGPPLLHIDLKFVSYEDIEEKVENPVILWERENRLSDILYKTDATFPTPDPQWIEERFWIWVHYCATKLGRGELFEVIDFLSFLRSTVLGPLILQKNNARPQGVRKLEKYASPEQLEQLRSTIPAYDFTSCAYSLTNTIRLYKDLRTVEGNTLAEKHVNDYLQAIISKLTGKLSL